jgi:hypothetical protein
MMYAVIQAVIITMVVAFCAVQTMRKLMPNLSHHLQAKGAKAFNRAGMPVFARKLQPVETPASGCGTCRGCALSELKR